MFVKLGILTLKLSYVNYAKIIAINVLVVALVLNVSLGFTYNQMGHVAVKSGII